MRKCACGEPLAGKSKVCKNCLQKYRLWPHAKTQNMQQSRPETCAEKNGVKSRRYKLIDPVSNARQREIDATIDSDAEKRFYLNPLDPRAYRTIQPSIWLWRQ